MWMFFFRKGLGMINKNHGDLTVYILIINHIYIYIYIIIYIYTFMD